ncbi:MAG: hypothetical protein IJ905_14160, partial [Fibrobacter sp.]|nr:hypothetical protein [Fibrobacter sp.]
ICLMIEQLIFHCTLHTSNYTLFIVAEYEREHETVRDGKIFERDVVWFHFSPLFMLYVLWQNKKEPFLF